MDSDEHARSTCGVLDLRQQLVRRCVWQWMVAGADVDGLLVPIGGEDSAALRRRCAGDDGRNAPRRDQHDTRRHPATSVSLWDGDR